MIHALLLAFLASPAFAYTPSPVKSSTDTRTINNNLLDIANEIERRSLVTGGTINGSLTVSSGIVSNGTNTWTGGQTFTSSFTFNTGTADGGATTKIAGTIARTGSLTTSSDQTMGTAPACYSTMTVTTNGGTLLVTFTGVMLGGASDVGHSSLLVDGTFPSPWTGAKGIVYQAIATDKNAGFAILVTGLAGGTHTICNSIWRDAGSSGALNCSTRSLCVLKVAEF